MNFSRMSNANTTEVLMKNEMNRITMAVLALVLTAGLGRAAGTNDWRFESSANPAPGGSLTANIALGQYASGWMPTSPLGRATGVWEVGRYGTIAVGGITGATGGTNNVRTFKLRVTQWNDGGLYNVATVSIPGAQLLGTNVAEVPELNTPGSIGAWIVHESQWRVNSGVAADSAVITGGFYGSVIDEVVLVSSSTPPGAPQLAIRRMSEGLVELSWPAAFNTMVPQFTSDVGNPASWSPVSGEIQVNGDVRSITLEAGETMRFYRLKQP
jgi:hypothetical protein